MMRVLLSVCLLLAVVAIYAAHVREATFVYEDVRYLPDSRVTPPATIQSVVQGRGLTRASWHVVETPRASHALNLALHLTIVSLTALLLWQITGSRLTAFAVAAVLAMHPLTTEGVAYAASRSDLLAAFGVLITLVCVTSPLSMAWAVWPWAAVLAYLGKETGIVACGLIPLVLWKQGHTRWAERMAWLLGSVAVGAFLVLDGPDRWRQIINIAEYGAGVTDPIRWALLQSAAVYRLIVLSIAPLWLSVSPDLSGVGWVTGAAAVVLLAGLLEIAWRCRHRAPLATFGIVWCAIVAAPRFVVQTPAQPFTEHHWYLAMVGVACCYVAALSLGRTEAQV